MDCVKEDFIASYPSFEFLKILSTFSSLQIYISMETNLKANPFFDL